MTMGLLRPDRVGLAVGSRTLHVAWATARAGGKLEYRHRTIQREGDGAEALRRSLSALLQPLRHARLCARVALVAPESTIRWLIVRVPDPKHLPAAVREQLPALLPFEVKQAESRYTVVNQQRVDSQLECTVSVAACESQTLHRDLQALWEIGWAPQAVLPAARALVQVARALKLLSPEPVLMIDLGEDRTTMALVHHGEVVYARDVTLGTTHLIEALMGQVSLGTGTLSLSREQAETLLRGAGYPTPEGQGPTGQVPVTTYLAMLQPVLEQLINEMRRTMAYGAQAATMPAPTQMLLSGEGAGLPGADRWLAAQVTLPVTRLDCHPWLGEERPDAAVVCGLTLASPPAAMDLQPNDARQRGMITRGAGWIWRVLLVLTMVVWGLSAWQGRRHQAMARDLQTLKARWESLQPVVTLQGVLDAQRRFAQRFGVTESVSLDWFRQLARGFPNALRLRSLTLDQDRRITMTGEAQAREQAPEAAIQSFTLWLEEDALCREVQLQSTRRIQADGSVVEFTVTCRMR